MTLKNDKIMDLSGVEIKGRKKIILKNYCLMRTGYLAVSEEGVRDTIPYLYSLFIQPKLFLAFANTRVKYTVRVKKVSMINL